MRYFIIFLIVLSFNSYAQVIDAYHCRQIDMFSFNIADEDFLNALSDLQDCPTDDEIILNKVKSDYKKFWGGKKVSSAYVKGFKLSGPYGMHALARKMLGSKPPKDWKEAAKNCSTLICAFGKLFDSEKAAMQAFNFNKKSGYYLSLDQSLNQGKGEQHWSAKEVQELDAAADKLPPRLQKMKLKKIERYADGLREAGHGNHVAAYATPVPELIFYDAGAKGSPKGRNSYKTTSWPQEVLIHELCHHHDFKYFDQNYELISERKGSVFGGISGWKEKTKKDGTLDWHHHEHANFVSNYASSSPAEDYAESCMSYILYPYKLEKKSPKKYAYMKKHVFKGKEYKSGSWVDKSKPKWQGLEDLLANEEGCLEKLSNCLKDVSYSYGQFCVKEGENGGMSWSTCGDIKRMLSKGDCLKDVKNSFIEVYAKELNSDEKFCDYGGVGAIQAKKDLICEASMNKIKANLKKTTNFDYKTSAKECEEDNDYSEACIIDKLKATLEIPQYENIDRLVKKAAKDKIPSRMKSLGNSLKDRKTNNWLPACLNSVSDVDFYKSSVSGSDEWKDSFSYEAKDKEYSSGYIGRFIYDDYKREDVNMACAKEMLKSLESEGVKVPKNGSPVNLLREHFKSELSSFENEVLINIPKITKKCLVFKKCKLNKIRELVQAWIKKSPGQRVGMDGDIFIKHIFEIAKPEF